MKSTKHESVQRVQAEAIRGEVMTLLTEGLSALTVNNKTKRERGVHAMFPAVV